LGKQTVAQSHKRRGRGHMKHKHYVGLDVHANSISVAVAPAGGGEVRSLGVVANEIGALRKLLKKVGDIKSMKICYEAGPCGYALYWALVELGAECIVVAPSLIPQKSGDKVKTDRKDAEKLARLLRAGELTAVWVPDREHEALRNLVRAREACRKDLRRAQQRVEKLLLREGRGAPMTTKGKSAGKKRVKSFCMKYMVWLNALKFEHVGTQQTFEDYKTEVTHQTDRLARLDKQIMEAVAAAPERLRDVVMALQALRGIAQTTAAVVAVEVGDFSRFNKPTQLMAWAGLVPSEHSSGGPGKARRYGITKSGNGHLRRVLTESAWLYRHKPNASAVISKRRLSVPAEMVAIAEKAEQRLNARYRGLSDAKKPTNKVTTAVARELIGFIWAIARDVEEKIDSKTAAAKPAKVRKYQLKKAA
jgi:transposase